MILNRRHFLLLTMGLAAGLPGGDDPQAAPASRVRIINAGAAANYTADGVYSQYRDLGFFIIRHGDRLFALSAVCTHRNCKLSAKPDASFSCKCHGSIFDPLGHVTRGPAKRNLPVLPSSTNEHGELLITVPSD